ncbi:NleF caspase inhibitor [Citrobacter rodentium]|nr:NleF caspase inhibitor [Citrobacter rodentium]KIQ51390.1 type III effector [Citrobacter rodentium]QBY31093.1 type III effector [Citrobacter rodentium]UHO31538.1 type III effector [Citrobacter rodentium NBRC 105723 = DSM 16636]HAT8012410.1 type III effector [Citrobacter rodentium NBRC 105723 = DSM 16636]HAT8017461.1 type III effector [Citrobacter rodentium]
MLPASSSSANLYSWMYISGKENPSTPESVSELNHNHFLSPELQEKLDVMFAIYSCARNNDERENIYPELRDFVSSLMDKRNNVFEVINEDTDEVTGALRAGMTIEDRDSYIRDLFFLHSLKVKIEESRQDKEDWKCKVYDLLCPHHSSELYGDLRAIKCLVEGCSDDFSPFDTIKVPDLTYNKGSLQIG